MREFLMNDGCYPRMCCCCLPPCMSIQDKALTKSLTFVSTEPIITRAIETNQPIKT